MYGEILFCASLTSSNVGMYIMLSLFLQILDNIPVPPKSRKRVIPENSNQPTPFPQWRFRSRPSHPSDSPNVRCEKLFLQLCRVIIHLRQYHWLYEVHPVFLVGSGIKTVFCSDKVILRRNVMTSSEKKHFCYEIFEDISTVLRHFSD